MAPKFSKPAPMPWPAKTRAAGGAPTSKARPMQRPVQRASLSESEGEEYDMVSEAATLRAAPTVHAGSAAPAEDADGGGGAGEEAAA
eukprot:2332596-Pyramimonas_sp.AAC.1